MSLLKLKNSRVNVLITWIAGFLISCGTSDLNNRGIVARIGNADSITAEELNNEIIKQRIVQSGKPVFIDKQRILLDMIELKIISLYSRQSQFSVPLNKVETESAVWTHVRGSVNQRFLENNFIDSAAVERYHAYSDEVLAVQAIVLYFNSNASSSDIKSQQNVKRRIDSIYSVCTSENFNELAKKHSEYAFQGVRNPLHPVKIAYKDMTFVMENAIFSVAPGKPSKPVAIGDGYAIFRLNSELKNKLQNKTKLSPNKFYQMKSDLIEKIKKDDASLYVELATSNINKEWINSNIRIDEKLIGEALREYRNSNASKTVPSFAAVAWVNENPIYTFAQILEKVIIDRAPDKISDSLLISTTREEIRRYLYKKIYIEEFGVNEAYFEYLTKNIELEKSKRKLEKSIDDSLTSKMTDQILKSYYEKNREKFARHLDVGFSEIKCVSFEVASAAKSLAVSGVVFEQIPEVVLKKNPHWLGKIKWVSNANLLNKPQCIRDRKLIFGGINDVSEVFENEDGTYSIVVVRRRNTLTSYKSYGDAGREVFGLYKAEKKEKIIQSIILDIAKKHPISIYTQNMQSIGWSKDEH